MALPESTTRTAQHSNDDSDEQDFAHNHLHEDDDSEDEQDETAMEMIALSDIPTETVVEARNNEPALQRKLAEIAIFTTTDSKSPRLDFRESLCITLPLDRPLPAKLAVDDLEREKEIAAATTEAVHAGLNRLRAERFKFRRPTDYFAQMVKTDEQMSKIKKRIMKEKEKIEEAQKRRNNRDLKKNRKKVRQEQLEKEQDKKKKANEEIAAVSRLRQDRLQKRAEAEAAEDASEDEGDDEFPIDMLDVEQLDEDNKFAKHADISSGKKKAWKGGQSGRERGSEQGRQADGKADGKNRRGTKVEGGIKKGKFGKKKRLGKSRRLARKNN